MSSKLALQANEGIKKEGIMFGIETIIARWTEVRTDQRSANQMEREWMSLQTRWRVEDEQRWKDEDSSMKRYLDLMQEANKQATQPLDKQAKGEPTLLEQARAEARRLHKKLQTTAKETTNND